MEKLNFAYQKQLGRQITNTSIACALGLCLPQLVPFAQAQESAVQKELNRRLEDARKANDLLHQGDTSYNKQDYKAAVAAYSSAFSLLPNGLRTQELRAAAADRYATAATEQSRELAKGGNYDQAKLLLDQVLQPNIAPAHLGALKLKAQIDDPIRYNHALTPEHVQDVQVVGIALRKADAHYNLGQYDKAAQSFHEVLGKDPFNKAARRGLEKVEATKSDYYRAAYDHTRSEMLNAVDKGWEMAVPPEVDTTLLLGNATTLDMVPTLDEKMSGITVEAIDLDDTTLEEAIDFVRIQSREGDAPSINGEKKGINIVLNLGDSESERAKTIIASRIDLKARDLPLSKVLDYITDQTHTKWRSDGATILITPLWSTEEVIVTRTFSVPPTFLISAAKIKTEDSGDVFDNEGSNSFGLTPNKFDITAFLKQNGISFPKGSSASYNPGSNALLVRNTPDNIDIIDQLIGNITDQEPVQVVIKTTIMRVSEKKLKSLGFDWLITPIGLTNALFLGGGTVGNGTQLLDMPLSPFSGLGNPLTSGIRSGETGLHADSIDTFINSENSGFGNTAIRAPGILTLTGVYSGVQVQMMMRGMDQQTGADVMAKPSTIARSGERAKIEIIREFIYPTEYEPPQIPDSIGSTTVVDLGTGESATSNPPTPITPAHPTAFETRNVGVTLEVEPTVGPNKQFIELTLQPQLVEFQGFVNYGSPINGSSGSGFSIDFDQLGTGNAFTSNSGTMGRITDNNILMPIFKATQLRNQTITIQDGATIVLGGVMTSRKTKIEDKVPILGDIPLAGRLFRSESEQSFNEAVIIMVQAELIDPAGTLWKSRSQ